MIISDFSKIIEIEREKYINGELNEFRLKIKSRADVVSFGKYLLPLLIEFPDENYLKRAFYNQNLIEFEMFSFEILKFFGDYVHRIPLTLNLVENLQFFEFAHFINNPMLSSVRLIHDFLSNVDLNEIR